MRNNLDRKINDKMYQSNSKRKWYHKITAFVLTFTMILAFLTPLDMWDFVKPGFADTGNGSGGSGTLYFETAQTTAIGEPITKYDYTITTKFGKFDQSSEKPLEITVDPDETIDLALKMSYVFSNEAVVSAIANNGGYIYYSLPENLIFDNNYTGPTSQVKDDAYALNKWGGADVPSGYYSIWNGDKTSNPLLVIHFTPDYVNYFSENNYLEGTIEFNGRVNRADTEEGDQILNFANGPEIKINFANDKAAIKKEQAVAKTDDSGEKYFEWKVTVTNPKGRIDLTNYKLSDVMNDAAFALNADNCTIDPPGDGSFINGEYVFSGKTKGNYAEQYTFTYRQNNPEPGKTYNNEATLTGGDEPVSSEATGKIENAYDAQKSGKPDYQMTGERDGNIYWEISVNNKSGNSLAEDKTYLIDPAFSEIVDGTLEVKDNDGNPMTEGTDYEIVNGKVYYKDDSGNLIDVTDTDDVTDAKEGEQFLIEDGKYLKINIVDLSKEPNVMKQAVIIDGKAYYKNWNGEPDYSAVVKYYTVETDAEGNQKIFAPDRYNANPYVIPDSNIINSPVMKFIGNSTASGAVITYATDADLGSAQSVDVKNPVYVRSEKGKDGPTSKDVEVPVTYKKELAVSKQAADGGFDPETELFKWQINVIVNSGDNDSLETIDGYVLKDAMFAHLTEDEIKSGFNAVLNNGTNDSNLNKYVVITKTSDDTIKITLDKTALETDGVTSIISGINLRYELPASDVFTEEQLAEYRKNNPVIVQNVATAEKEGELGYSATDGIGITAEGRSDIGKVYVGNGYNVGDDYIIDGNSYIIEKSVADDEIKTLHWKISLTKDNGFNHDDVILSDTLGSETYNVGTNTVDNTITVPHYITKNQTELIELRGKTSQHSADNPVITKDMYEVIPVPEDSDSEEYTGFKIKFNEKVDAEKYRYITVEYATTAKVSEVPAGYKTVFNNTAEFGGELAPQTGLTFEYEDVNSVRPTTLKLNKNWNDNQNAFSTRPSEIKVKVLRALENTNVWEYITDEDSGEPVIYTLPVSDNMVIGEFPQWKVEKGQPVYYQYKVEEILDEDSLYEAQKDVVAVKSDNLETRIELTNTLKSGSYYGKKAENPESYLSGLQKVTRSELGAGNMMTDVEYYIFKWTLNFDLTEDTSSDRVRTFTDTMPNGFIYVTDEINNEGLKTQYNTFNAKTYYYYKDNHNYCTRNNCYYDHSGESVTVSGNTITFKLRENISSVEYYTMIKADELSRAMTNGVITNKIRLQEKGETDHIATVTITDEPETDNENIKKSYRDGGKGVLRYSLDFNPEGKKLSNTKYVEITDTLKLDSNSVNTADMLDFTLAEMKVFEYNPDGTYSEISKSDYRYTVNYSHNSETKHLPLTHTEKRDRWTINGWQNGEELSVTVVNTNCYLKVYEYDSRNQAYEHGQNISNGTSSVTFTIGADTQNIEVWVENADEKYTEVLAKVPVEVPAGETVNTPAVLKLNVPDQKYLRIEYTYNVSGYTHAPTGSKNNTTVVVSNTAAFETANAAGYDSSDHNAMNVDDSSATSATQTYPEIYKVDANSLSISNLAAKFKVLKYDKEQHNWIYASNISITTESGVKFNQIDFEGGAAETATLDTSESNILIFTGNEKAEVHKVQLDPDTLYKFIEIEAPVGYRQPPESTSVADYEEFTYYYSYVLNGDIPAELSSIKDKFISVTKDGRIDIPNSKCISVSAEKIFSGKSEDIPANAEIQLQLQWSYDQDGNNLMPIGDLPIDDAHKSEYQTNAEGTIIGKRQLNYTNDGDNTVTWKGLPDAINGKPVYYFVQELHYSYTDKNGNTVSADPTNFDTSKFKPIYTNNGTNIDGDKITVNNAGGLVIRKEWKDINGNIISPPNEPNKDTGMEIGFILTAKVKATDEEITLAIDEKLTPDNNYEYAINVSEKISDTNGNEYYVTELKNFQITENLTLDQQFELGDDYVSSPAYELSNNLGLIKLINTSTVPTSVNVSVQKIWKDNRNASVKVRVIKTTTPNLTSDEIAALTWNDDNVAYHETLTYETGLAKTWTNLPTTDENGKRYYYYVQEYNIETGITASYEVEVSKEEQKTIITNSTETQIVVEKKWGTSTPDSYKNTVTVQLYRKTNSSGWAAFGSTKTISSVSDWKTAFTGLDKTDAYNNTYQYKVEEVKVGDNQTPGNVFDITYSSQEVSFSESESSKTITVTNTPKTGKIKIRKVWEMNGAEVTETSIDVTLTDNKGNTRTETLTRKNDSWEWEVEGLPLYAADGTQLTYTVEEIPISGYDVSYNNTNVNVTPSSYPSNAVTITNTYTQFTMKIQKDWDGKESDHVNDEITVVIHRSKTQNGDSELPLIKTLDLTVSAYSIVIDGNPNEATLTATLDGAAPDDVTYEVFNDSSCTEISDKVTISGNVVTPVSEGTVWIRAKSDIYTSKPVKLTINPKPTENQPVRNHFPYGYGDGATTFGGIPEQWQAGEKLKISFEYTGEGNPSINGGIFDTVSGEWFNQMWNATISNGHAEIIVENGKGRTINHPQIQLWWCDGYSEADSSGKRTENDRTDYAPVSITSVELIGGGSDNPEDNYPEFVNNEYTIEKIFGSDLVNAGSRIVFELKGTPNNNFTALIGGHLTTHTGWEWTELPEQSKNFDSDGNATVTISFNTDFLIRKLQVKNYYGGTIKVVSSTLIPPTQPQAAPPRMTAPTSSGSDTAVSSIAKQRIVRYGRVTQAEDIIEDNTEVTSISEAATMLMASAPVRMLAKAAPGWTDNQLVVTINSSNSWIHEIDLPMYDENHEKYYYWIEETLVKPSGGTNVEAKTRYDISYKFSDNNPETSFCIDSANPGSAEITIKNTEKEISSAELPETGGSGTAIYYVIGSLLLILTAAGYVTYRRRRWSDE